MQSAGVEEFAGVFAQTGVVTLSNILPEALANSLHEEFGQLHWVLQVKDYSQSTRFELPLALVKNRNNLVGELYDRSHEIDLDDLFYLRLAVAVEDLNSPAMKSVVEFLNSERFISSCRRIVGINDISHAWVEATCYDKGCFLGNHADDHHPANRVAFVLNMTRDWKLDWGGLLLLEAVEGEQPMILPPLWNSLSLFRIPVNHTVTSVAQSATGHRYSITGWLRP